MQDLTYLSQFVCHSVSDVSSCAGSGVGTEHNSICELNSHDGCT